MLRLTPHPLAYLSALTTELPVALGKLPSPDWLTALLAPTAAAPVHSDDALRGHVRDLLRHGGYKPTGRGKPASEYLLKAAAEGLRSINALVDVCNVVSLHSGFPISVVDLTLARPPFHVAIAPADSRYVFNAAGQEIDLGGLLCLFDVQGPCANAVKDSQRTKTHPETEQALFVLWGATTVSEQLARAQAWTGELLERLGANAETLVIGPG